MAYILVVEDDKKIAQFITDGFRQSGHSAECVADAQSAEAAVRAAQFTIAVVDVMLEGSVDGIQMVKNWRESGISVPVIFLSARSSVDDRLAGFEAGADDYVVKPFSFTELKARVESILRRAGRHPDSSVITYHDLTLDMLKRQAHRAGVFIDLRRREFMLLQLLMENAEQVLGKTMILERVWGYDFDPQTNVVDVLVSRLRAKIDKGFDASLIHTIRGVGYVLKQAPPTAS